MKNPIVIVLIAGVLMLSLETCNDRNAEKPTSSPKVTAFALEQAGSAGAKQFTEIDTSCGKIKGLKEKEYSIFEGIKYANADRWETAVPVKKWEGEYDATKFGSWCCQFKGFFGLEDSPINQFYYDEATVHYPVKYSEDCLNLNIWKPDKVSDCPVLIFIHGGAFMTGGNSDSFIDGAAYTKRGVILISVNYRLGPFSSVYGDGYTGDYGLTDLIAALKWVRDNIKDYGGNPNKVTVMGESAGAVSVQDLLISPLAKGLLNGAIMISGGGDISPLSTPTTPSSVEPIWIQLKKDKDVNTISELKNIPALDLYAAWANAVSLLPEYSASEATPIVNGSVLPMNVGNALKNGLQANVPCIIGVLSEDMYPSTLYNAALEYGASQYKAGNKPVYTYYFDRQLPGENNFGAFHGADLWYAFGTLNRNWRPFNDIDCRISDNMIGYISNFVRTGNPNGKGLSKWTPVTDISKKSLHFGDKKAAMFEPSLDELKKTQQTHPAFPYK